MKLLKLAAVGLGCLAWAYFGYQGVTTRAWEGDSLAYHIPIAKIIANGQVGYQAAYKSFLDYYPATGEAMLAVMVKVGWPLNLFNWAGWVFMVSGIYRWGRMKGLSREAAAIWSFSAGLWPSVIRLFTTQTVDIWMAGWWVGLAIRLEQPNPTKRYWAILGIFSGAVMGMKYSGPAYVLILLGYYGKQLIKAGNWKRWIIFAVMAWLVGGIWYTRNWIWTGNPLYPGSLGRWQGVKEYKIQNWQPIKTLVMTEGGGKLMLQALVSEYLMWAVAPLVIIGIKKRIGLLAWLNWGVYLITPSWPENILSDLRYTYVAMIPTSLAVWLWCKEQGKEKWLGTISILNGAAVLPQLNYYPKLLVGILAALAVYIWRKEQD